MANLTSNNKPFFSVSSITKSINGEGIILPRIHNYFQLATMFVSKLQEIETIKEKVILVVDDEPLTIELIEEYFQEANFPCSILSARNGSLAFALAESKLPDLIITDLIMPYLDGMDLMRQLKENDRTKDIPIILTTGAYLHDKEMSKIFAIGAIDLIRKPLVDHDLISRVKAALAFQDALKEIKEREDEVLEINTFTEAGEVILTKQNELQELKTSVEKLQSELESNHQRLVLKTELLIHSKNVKSNLLAAMHKLQPYVTSEGKAKFFTLLKKIHWEINDEASLQFESDFDQLHGVFYDSLEKNCPGITKNEKRLCVYIKMNHSASDIARMTNRSLNSINVALARLRIKLQANSSKALRNFLIEIS